MDHRERKRGRERSERAVSARQRPVNCSSLPFSETWRAGKRRVYLKSGANGHENQRPGNNSCNFTVTSHRTIHDARAIITRDLWTSPVIPLARHA